MDLQKLFSDCFNRYTSGQIRLYTLKSCYTISFSFTPGKERTYLGCIMEMMFPEPGENWTRMSDFPDGEFNDKTWNAIKEKISEFEGTSWEKIPFNRVVAIEFSDREYVNAQM